MAAKSLNEVRLLGNLTRDPEIKITEKGKKICKFGIATNRSWKLENETIKTETDFHNIVCFEKRAEICEKYLKKGSKVYIYGSLRNHKYIKNNETRTMSQIYLNDMIMLDKKPADQEQTEQTEQEAPEEVEIYTDELAF